MQWLTGMRTQQFLAATIDDLRIELAAAAGPVDLVVVFASFGAMSDPRLAEVIGAAFPDTPIAGCSGAGQIHQDGAQLDGVVVTAVTFSHTRVRLATATIPDLAGSFAAGEQLADGLPHDELTTVLVLSPGVDVNGSALLAGMQARLPAHITVSGGLAGDPDLFRETLTLADRVVAPRQAVAIGLYGGELSARFGSRHGWRPLGALRRVTRGEGNLLHELDGEPALDVYRRYLGPHAEGLPHTALLFPFEIVGEDCMRRGPIRTILGIDQDTGVVTLAGDIETNGYLRMMHASTDALVDGAEEAAAACGPRADSHALALLVSCVGRRLIMGHHADAEIEAVRTQLGDDVRIAGFYSFGEIAPGPTGACHLHNQTMTITYLFEPVQP